MAENTETQLLRTQNFEILVNIIEIRNGIQLNCNYFFISDVTNNPELIRTLEDEGIIICKA